MKITPSGLIDTITQSSGGTTIQNSYGGLQLHRKAYQIRKKSVPQQNTRARFTNVQSSWGDLSEEEQETWNTAAPSGTSGFQLYSSTNNLLVGTGLDPISEYVSPVTPPDLTFSVDSQSYDYGPTDKKYDALITVSGGTIDLEAWQPYVRMFGWIQSSQFRLPSKPIVVPRANISSSTGEDFAFRLNQASGLPSINFQPGSKAHFNVYLISLVTGQLQDYLQYDATAV